MPAEQEESEPVQKKKRAHKHRHHHRNKKANEAYHESQNPYDKHRAYQEHFLVMEQQVDEKSNTPLSEHETKEMDFFLDNGLMILAQQIAQDQKDLHALEEL